MIGFQIVTYFLVAVAAGREFKVTQLLLFALCHPAGTSMEG